MKRFLVPFLFSAVLAVSPCQALEWERTTAEITAKPGADAVFTTFSFQNTGAKTVRVLGITSTCGCTEAVANPNEIAPGQTGMIEVVFTIGERTGTQERQLTIQTDDAKTPTALTLRVTIPPRNGKPTPGSPNPR